MSLRRRKPVVTISEVKLRPRPPQRSCGSQTSHVKNVFSEENLKEPPAPPPTPPLPDIQDVTVKFYFNEASVVTRVYNNYTTLAEVKLDLGKRFEVEPGLLILRQFDCELSNECSIYETIDDDLGIYNYNLVLSADLQSSNVECNSDRPSEEEDYWNYRKTEVKTLDIETYNNKYRMPDTITVQIAPSEDDETAEEMDAESKPKTVTVEIGRKLITRNALCGYKNKNTGAEYIHNYSQTGPIFDKDKYSRYVSRDTQTYELKPCLIDTSHDHSTQCWLDGNNVLYWSEPHDYYITPGKYQTFAQKERLENKLGKIKLIQRNFRRVKWARWMKACAAEYRRLIANRNAEEEASNEEVLRRIKREERMRQFPCTKNDFDLLYTEIHNWKMAELKRITQMYEGVARIAEINILLDKEIELLNALNRQRSTTLKSLEVFRRDKMLEKMGTPIKWCGYGNTVIHMDLLRTQRVRFLNEVYQDICKALPKEERIELIDKVLVLLQREADFPDFPQLFELFEREKNLLIHAKSCDVEVLRKRQNLFFLELIKFDREPKLHEQGNRLCTVCKKVKPYSQFLLHTRQYNVDTCSHCHYLKVPSVDQNIYMPILRTIQREERRRRCNGSFAFVMQMEDIRYLMLQVWHSHSILSKVDDIKLLRLPRWNKAEEWSPWNCVCLTAEEARSHERIDNLESVYDHKLILEVGNRHKLARSTFRKMAAVAVEFTESGRWWKVGLNPQRAVRLSDITAFPTTEKMLRPNTNDRLYTLGKVL